MIVIHLPSPVTKDVSMLLDVCFLELLALDRKCASWGQTSSQERKRTYSRKVFKGQSS